MISVHVDCNFPTCTRGDCGKPGAPCQAGVHAIEAAARQLVDEARRLGFVLTIEQQSLMPPAMGNYRTVVQVRAARAAAPTLSAHPDGAESTQRSAETAAAGVPEPVKAEPLPPEWQEFMHRIKAAPSLAAMADVMRAKLAELNATDGVRGTCTVEANGGARCSVECCYLPTCTGAPGVETGEPTERAVSQAQSWAQEARTQRATVLEILRYFGLPEHDWEALHLIRRHLEGTHAKCPTCGAEQARAALAVPVEPVVWIQSDHLQKAKIAPHLCRVEPRQREGGFTPLYAAVPVEPQTKRIRHYRNALEAIIRQPEETMSDAKAMRAMLTIARAALKAAVPVGAGDGDGVKTGEVATDAMRWNDRFMEVLPAIHGPVNASVNDSVRLAFAQTLSEFIADGVPERQDALRRAGAAGILPDLEVTGGVPVAFADQRERFEDYTRNQWPGLNYTRYLSGYEDDKTAALFSLWQAADGVPVAGKEQP